MESSIGLVFRALVMLACLAVVPLVAMYGKYAPDFAAAVMEAYKARTHGQQPGSGPPGTGNAPPFSSGGVPGPAPLPAPGALGANPPDMPAKWADASGTPRPLSQFSTQGASSGKTGDPPGALQQAAFTEPAGRSPSTTGANGAAPIGSAASPASDSDHSSTQCAQFSGFEQRLRELGATYYLLEAWGPSPQQYRFICHMPLAGSAKNSATRIFEATATSPLDAMHEVLTQIEHWRAGVGTGQSRESGVGSRE